MTQQADHAASPEGLPVVGSPRERRDAAANRQRILCAAREVLAHSGAEGLSMNAVATAAGVGKGTIFRRFGDRDGLTEALLDAHTVELQNGFLFGPPPLGPGAAAAQRLEAFVRALVAFQLAHLEIVIAAERSHPGDSPPYGTFLLHLRTLLEQLDPRLDAPVLAQLLLSALAPRELRRLLRAAGGDERRVADGAARLARAVTFV